MCGHLDSAHRPSLWKRILFFVSEPRLSFLIATLTALCTPSLASAQGTAASFDASTSKSGTDAIVGNYIYPSGGYSLSAFGGAEIELVEITAELQYLSGGVWTSFNPPQVQKAAPAKAVWETNGWDQIQGGFGYRVLAIMNYRYKFNPNDPWTPDKVTNTNFQRAFP